MQQRIDLQNQLLLSPETPDFCSRGWEKEEEEKEGETKGSDFPVVHGEPPGIGVSIGFAVWYRNRRAAGGHVPNPLQGSG